MSAPASNEVPDITGISSHGSSYDHHCGIINGDETTDRDTGKLTTKVNTCSSSDLLEEEDEEDEEDDDDDDDDGDAMMLLNDVCKIRTLGTMQSQTTVNSSVSSGTAATTITATKTERQLSHDGLSLSGRPGSYSVTPETSNTTTTQSNPTNDSDYNNNSGIQENDSSLCVAQSITAAMIATEREMIYQEAMERFTANAARADIMGTGKEDEEEANENDRPPSLSSDEPIGVDGVNGKHIHDDIRRRRQRQCIALVTIVALVTVITMGIFHVVRRQRNNKNESTVAPSGTVDTKSTTTPAIETMYPSSSPPATNIRRDAGVFYTTDELYEAVDAYLIALYHNTTASNSTTTSPETSAVALRYGYPMNTWNVSLLTNFTRVFDPSQSIPFDPYAEIPLYPTNMAHFNEDLSLWDVSNAVTLFGMFAFMVAPISMAMYPIGIRAV